MYLIQNAFYLGRHVGVCYWLVGFFLTVDYFIKITNFFFRKKSVSLKAGVYPYKKKLIAVQTNSGPLSFQCSGGGGNFVLSSSLVGYTTVLGVVAPMVHHGYGFFYRIRDDRWADSTKEKDLWRI